MLTELFLVLVAIALLPLVIVMVAAALVWAVRTSLGIAWDFAYLGKHEKEGPMGFNEADIRRVIWTAVQAFLGAVLVLAPGILQAPNLETAKTLGVAALVAGIAAALSALKNLILPDTSTIK